jgi:hypothetical protein
MEQEKTMKIKIKRHAEDRKQNVVKTSDPLDANQQTWNGYKNL